MKKIDTSKVLTLHDGTPMKQDNEVLTLGNTLSNILSFTKSDNSATSFKLGKQFATEKEVELSAQNIVFLRKVIESSDFFPIVKGQILEEIGE